VNIREYFSITEGVINSCPLLTSVDFHSEIIDSNFGYFKAEVVFYDHSRLFLFELVTVENRKSYVEKYRYHYQNAEGKLIFRWDNAPHFPKLKSFPHHLHIADKVKESTQPTIHNVLNQVIARIETT
jgi:hypothetical protein